MILDDDVFKNYEKAKIEYHQHIDNINEPKVLDIINYFILKIVELQIEIEKLKKVIK